ncbi:MAG TPA: hypothetical protein VGS57_11150 [Thermoanaerobaculia bacterium]|nr:hypothetical protein [Thermoanaerobaculia bacterium]
MEASPDSFYDTGSTAQPVETRLRALEARLAQKPHGKDGWDKFEKVSGLVWSVVTLLVSIFVTSRIEHALKERQLHLENVKDMQALMQQLDQADSDQAMTYTLALGAHGRYAVAPMIQVLQRGRPEHREAAMAGLRAAAAIEPDFVCQRLIDVIGNRTRLYQVEVHDSAAQLLGDLDCRNAVDPLRDYQAVLATATPAAAPFTAIPGTAALTPSNIADVKKRVEISLQALTRGKT